ncbi:type VI secretion system protein TssA [Pseudomonas aeruginosa]|uniref:type VI secretion system protein TssA n=1 Tax=Pseudomonas aeruginosa TaxID=287 RepID=UPI00053EC1AF|nr:type VI secretion system protein TssA [Pseudomonas aeruginosa]WCV80999.1 type VI secretion system protein TssA [Pseudomonas aeruginosa]HBO0859718.1 type VI secretion system protein TssA [Pseudomonas aeruginosa]HCE6879270.1 type VI secretion system protein TssA [Pseudomonas aeruginosa]HDR2971466.1 type VI secretion system protein TssA [Pseudomonas aeruginosa]
MSSLPQSPSLDELLAPIDGGAGEDLAFSALFDQIKEARRADPVYLTQGEWETDLKQADWDVVVDLATEGIRTQSKDLMLAGWLTEGLTQKYHFQGLAFGLELTDSLLQHYWDSLFPSLDEGLEERAARLGWQGTTLAEVIGNLPLTQGSGYGLNRYEESRQVENLTRQNASAGAAALEEGKINAEIFQRSVTQTETEFLLARHAQVTASVEAFRRLQAGMDTHFGHEAPSLRKLEEKLLAALQLLERVLKERGVEQVPQTREEPGKGEHIGETHAEEAPPAAAVQQQQVSGLRTIPLSREEAFTMLANAADYFRHTEPQSPVPYLVERAIRWGHMPLEEWLKDVIKDNGVIDSIKSTLGTQSSSD